MQPASEVIATDFFGRTIVKAVPAVAEGDTEGMSHEHGVAELCADWQMCSSSSPSRSSEQYTSSTKDPRALSGSRSR